ncbi:MAG: alanine racemase [Balneolaceae bacterium]
MTADERNLEPHDPRLRIDEERCRANIKRLKQKADRHNLLFKPHFKTHQSADIGSWFRQEGVTAITVSSVRMAEYFADAGWTDITLAFPVNVREAPRLSRLARKIDLCLLIADLRAIPMIDNTLDHPVQAYIEIDTGSSRSGFYPGDTEEIGQAVAALGRSAHLSFRGFYSHPGHSYNADSVEKIDEIHRDALGMMRSLKSRFSSDRLVPRVCQGDTPCCTLADDFDGMDEMSPGNIVFYDLMQYSLGVCKIDQIAVMLEAPVVAVYPNRSEAVVHGGAVHLSKESLNQQYGRLVDLKRSNNWQPVNGAYVKKISQEHGIIHGPGEFIRRLTPGDIVGILPVHSCLTADLMAGYFDRNDTFINHMKAC